MAQEKVRPARVRIERDVSAAIGAASVRSRASVWGAALPVCGSGQT